MVHNQYGLRAGEEASVQKAAAVLQEHGHHVVVFRKSTADLLQRRFGMARAFLSGIRNPSVAREFHSLLVREKPDVVQVQNVYPAISPLVFAVAARAGVPVVMRCSNYRLVCPTGLLLSKRTGEVCERCVGGHEYWCVLRNCEDSFFKSLGYAARTAYARLSGAILRHATMYLSPSEFLKSKLVSFGIPEDRVAVIPTCVSVPDEGHGPSDGGRYVAFVGRVSREKGVPLVLAAARLHRDIPFEIAGDFATMKDLPASSPPNVTWRGHLQPEQVSAVYRQARMVVVPSVCYDTFPNVALEAMAAGKPVVGSRIGGIPEIVDDGRTGRLFNPGDAAELAATVRSLWDRPDLCCELGLAGRAKCLREYSPERYYERLMALYGEARQLAKGAGAHS